MIQMSCTLCQDDPQVAVQLGCIDPTPVAVWEDSIHDDQYYNCPLRFISDAHALWFQRYRYYREYPSAAPSYEEVSARYLEAAYAYQQYRMEFDAMLDDKRSKKLESAASYAKSIRIKGR